MAAATLAELKAACAGASGDFLVSQLEAGADVQTALQAHNAQLRQELANRPATLPGKPQGVTPTRAVGGTQGETAGGDAKAEWDEAVAAQKAKGLPNHQATINANRQNPGLRERMLAEVNAGRSLRS